jgi:hypothetical protein
MSEICCNFFLFHFVFCGSINKDYTLYGVLLILRY